MSTVNGGSLDRVLKLFRNGALTEEVQKKTPAISIAATPEKPAPEFKPEISSVKKVVVTPTQILKDPLSSPKQGKMDDLVCLIPQRCGNDRFALDFAPFALRL